ncbi:sigma-70 family RNA polymerase sigma factor [Streptomyces sp. MZ04]|nr:sigma-70 family RNA polymerase sigma factor [Streptomyces sp. MZ04]
MRTPRSYLSSVNGHRAYRAQTALTTREVGRWSSLLHSCRWLPLWPLRSRAGSTAWRIATGPWPGPRSFGPGWQDRAAHGACSHSERTTMAEEEAVTVEVLGALYAKYRVSLTATAQRELLARGLPDSVVSAEDVVQNAFAKALRNPESIEHPISYLRVLIRTEVANRARQRADHGRKEARRAADPLRFDPVQSADFAALVANRCAIEQALAGLSLPQRTAVWATKALDCTQAEAASLMDRSPGTVATHVSRGMVLLRASLVAAVVATLVCAAGRSIGGRVQRTEPAREPGDGAGASPTRWWDEGRAMLVGLQERWPGVAWLLLLAACGILWWVWRSFLGSRPGMFLGGWLSVRRTRRVWGRVVRLELADGPPRQQRFTPNIRLQDLFRLAGWSKGELAGLVNRQAAAMGHPQVATDTSRVRRWIDRGEIPRDPVPRVLAALFTERLGRVVTIEDLGLVRHGRVGKRLGGGASDNPDQLPWAPERTAAVLTEFTGMDLMLNRRGLVGVGAALAAGTAASSSTHDWPYTGSGRSQQAEVQRAESLGKLDTQAQYATREAWKILEVVTHAPGGVVSRAQIARSLRTFGRVEAAALSMLIRQGYVHQLPDSKYTAGQDLGSLVAYEVSSS